MTDPVTLAIDTARERLALALAMDEGQTDTEILDLPRGHAEKIMDMIGTLLARNDFDYAELERIAVTTGPGSFTGLRIGLSVARALGLALSIPVIGVPGLLALSLSRQGAHTIVLDAKRGQAYVQKFSAPGISEAAPSLVGLDDALAQAGKPGPDSPYIDIATLALFARSADPAAFPPDPTYIRAADAKPQTKGKVVRA